MDNSKKIIQHISNKRDIEISKRLEYMQSLNKKGIRKPDKQAKSISRKVGFYTKLLSELELIIN